MTDPFAPFGCMIGRTAPHLRRKALGPRTLAGTAKQSLLARTQITTFTPASAIVSASAPSWTLCRVQKAALHAVSCCTTAPTAAARSLAGAGCGHWLRQIWAGERGVALRAAVASALACRGVTDQVERRDGLWRAQQGGRERGGNCGSARLGGGLGWAVRRV